MSEGTPGHTRCKQALNPCTGNCVQQLRVRPAAGCILGGTATVALGKQQLLVSPSAYLPDPAILSKDLVELKWMDGWMDEHLMVAMPAAVAATERQPHASASGGSGIAAASSPRRSSQLASSDEMLKGRLRT